MTLLMSSLQGMPWWVFLTGMALCLLGMAPWFIEGERRLRRNNALAMRCWRD